MDTETKAVGEVILEKGLEAGVETVMAVMKPRSRHGEEPQNYLQKCGNTPTCSWLPRSVV
ncbi:MAG: hypothetical protein QXZ22_03450 [Sulfolobales archaeon]